MGKRPPKKGQVRDIAPINTLLIDGNALFKVGYHGALKEVNWKGEKIGGIYQFITVLRKLLNEDLYHKVYVFWDGPLSGKLRYEVYSDYKISRGKCYLTGVKSKEEDPFYRHQQLKVKKYLEDLFVRQFEDEVCEGDDLIAYYCLNKQPNEKITICTNDRDICQLVDDDIRIYLCNSNKKLFLTKENFFEVFGYHYSNVKLIKVITGDSADDIKGIKGVQEKTLLSNFPELKTKGMDLDEILEKAKEIQEERLKNKKKPLEGIQNIIEGRTDGIQGNDIYKINNAIIDLKKPFVTIDCAETMDEYMLLPLNPEGRDMKNVYQYIKEDGIGRLIGTNNLADYLLPFKKISEREINNFNNYKF